MMKKLKLMAGASIAALLLAACGNTFDPIDPFPQEEKIPATASDSATEPVVRDVTVAAGESALFEVAIPQQIISDYDYVWFVLSTDQGIDELILYDAIAGTPNRKVISRETGWFDVPANLGDTPPQVIPIDLTPSDIDLAQACTGPCVSHATADNIGTVRYLRVEADANTTFDLYVYGVSFNGNAGLSRQSAIELTSDEAMPGAIIWSGMEQWYHVEEAATSVTLSHVTPAFTDMAFQADVFLAGDLVQPTAELSATNPTHTFEGSESDFYIRVYSFNETRAAAPGQARYTISVEAPAVIPIGN